MTRSVEIPEEAVEAGAKAYYDYNSYADVEPDWSVWAAKDGEETAIYRNAARIVLAAALPYLAPAAADLVMTKEAHDFLANWKYNDVRISTDEAIAETMRLMKPSYPPAAVGDGGLREALEAVLDQHECTQPDTPKFNRAVLDDLLAAVAAHPVVDSTELKEKTMSVTKETSAAPTRLANRNGLRVGELIEFLQTQDPDAPVAAGCGCGPSGWSAPATDAHADSSTAVNVGACVKIGWGDFE